MNVRDDFIIHRALQGDTMKKIIEQLREKGIPTAKKTVSKVLNNNGFTYDKNNHKWYGSQTNVNIIETNSSGGNTEEKLEIENRGNTELIETEVKTNNMPAPDYIFSPDELSILKIMINERMQQDMAASTTTENDIYGEIAKLRVRRRKNKTFYVSEEITDDVAQLADKMNIKISQFVEVALLDAIKKYKR
ncbi:hypothetical protein [Rummeliibacillus stabekisii]|uniref:hypothetical protein n=1 Tax=Rummeliibacillus stabekisii TaxID=241244 RepID=UPI003724A341